MPRVIPFSNLLAFRHLGAIQRLSMERPMSEAFDASRSLTMLERHANRRDRDEPSDMACSGGCSGLQTPAPQEISVSVCIRWQEPLREAVALGSVRPNNLLPRSDLLKL